MQCTVNSELRYLKNLLLLLMSPNILSSKSRHLVLNARTLTLHFQKKSSTPQPNNDLRWKFPICRGAVLSPAPGKVQRKVAGIKFQGSCSILENNIAAHKTDNKMCQGTTPGSRIHASPRAWLARSEQPHRLQDQKCPCFFPS